MRIEIYKRRNWKLKRRWYWLLRADTKHIMATGTGYKSLPALMDAVQLIRKQIPLCDINLMPGLRKDGK